MKTPKPQLLPSGRYFVRLRLDGQNYSRTFDSEKEAEAWALSIKAQYKANQLAKKTPAEKKTLRQLVTEYKEVANFAPGTVATYDNVLKNWFQQIIDKPYCEIRNWQKVINLECQKHNTNTVRARWAKICASLNFHGLDVPKVKIPKKQPQKKNYLDSTQIKVFCDAIHGHRHEAYFLMMLSSMRVGEALGVEDGDISEKGIHVRGTKTEASDRFIPFIIPRLKEICYNRPFTAKTTLNRELKTICADAGLPELSCHSLRISFASVCYSKGVPSRVCMKLGGWSSLDVMHSVYIRISDDDVGKYANILNDVFIDKTVDETIPDIPNIPTAEK